MIHTPTPDCRVPRVSARLWSRTLILALALGVVGAAGRAQGAAPAPAASASQPAGPGVKAELAPPLNAAQNFLRAGQLEDAMKNLLLAAP